MLSPYIVEALAGGAGFLSVVHLKFFDDKFSYSDINLLIKNSSFSR